MTQDHALLDKAADHFGAPKSLKLSMGEKQARVRAAIADHLRIFVGREIDDELRWRITDEARKIGAEEAKKLNIRAPKVVVDKDPKDPRRIAVRISFPAGGLK